MELVPFKRAYIDAFLGSAAAEGWITTQAELEFLLSACPDCCLVCLFEGKPAAFITALRYERSAWIGNLLVLPAFRGRGLGRGLMEQVLRRLETSGAETVWLTASAAGAHLYRTLGFTRIDRVQRWRGSGRGTIASIKAVSPATAAFIDSLGWGDSRGVLFAALPENGSFFSDENAFLQQTAIDSRLHIGPWGAVSAKAAAEIFAEALSGEGPMVDIFMDTPENNHAAGDFLLSQGFTVFGSTLLMYKGRMPTYRPEYIYSLASMGSYG